jgi:hypothetical protein
LGVRRYSLRVFLSAVIIAGIGWEAGANANVGVVAGRGWEVGKDDAAIPAEGCTDAHARAFTTAESASGLARLPDCLPPTDALALSGADAPLG